MIYLWQYAKRTQSGQNHRAFFEEQHPSPTTQIIIVSQMPTYKFI